MARYTCYVARRREFIEIKNNPWRGGRVASYGSWWTLGRYATLAEAEARCQQETRGLFQTAVFLRGKRVTPAMLREQQEELKK